MTQVRIVPAAPLGPLTYLWGNGSSEESPIPPIGTLVFVPLGPRQVRGILIGVEDSPPQAKMRLKEVLQVEDDLPPVPKELLLTLDFAAQYYGIPLGEWVRTMLPSLPKATTERYSQGDICALPNMDALPAALTQDQAQGLLALAAKHPKGFGVVAAERILNTCRPKARRALRLGVEAGILRPILSKTHQRQAIAYAWPKTPTQKAPTQKTPQKSAAWIRVAQYFQDSSPQNGVPISAAALIQTCKASYAQLAKWSQAGLLEKTHLSPENSQAHSETSFFNSDNKPQATGDQARALAAALEQWQKKAQEKSPTPILLQGVTGSGKTEVYLRLIENAQAHGQSALVLVPEIALTPQLARVFQARFGDKVCTFHSELAAGERLDAWENILTGKISIAVGARSALFLPLQNLGVIVVDEEHEGTFKQESLPRYHARDLALMRAHNARAVVILGSATPSLESTFNAHLKRYLHLRMPTRVAKRPMPIVYTVDLSSGVTLEDDWLSPKLKQALEKTLARGEQAILFLNRRGFSPYVFCRDCGHSYGCDDCAVTRTLYVRRQILECNYCGSSEPIPDACSECESLRLESSGGGTEKVEETLRRIFPEYTTVRLDRDAARGRNSVARILDTFRNQKAQILVGTQMVAKGHDFPGVTLVGILNADSTLHFPDFRAAERTFQLLTQVAGRAGRGDKPGQVWLQTYQPDHHALQCAQKHDFEAFYREEIALREELAYPPFSHLALIRCSAKEEAKAQHAAQKVAEALLDVTQDPKTEACEVHGPAAAPLARLQNAWRYQVMLKAPSRAIRRLALVQANLPNMLEGARISIDLDPVSML